jgi:transcriptional regulator with XRE-family HTH domain
MTPAKLATARRLRESRQQTLEEIAGVIGVSRSTLVRHLAGREVSGGPMSAADVAGISAAVSAGVSAITNALIKWGGHALAWVRKVTRRGVHTEINKTELGPEIP